MNDAATIRGMARPVSVQVKDQAFERSLETEEEEDYEGLQDNGALDR